MKTFKNEFLEKMLNQAAWKKLSENYCWTKDSLKEHQYEVNWKAICENCEIKWTTQMLELFKERIDWKVLSANISNINITLLEKFKDYWDFSKLSGNTNFKLTEKMIDQFADLWDWEQIIGRYQYDDNKLFSFNFFEKYESRIPLTELWNSNLWDELVDQRKADLEEQL